MRGIGRELELALSCPLDGQGDAPSDRHRAQEHEDEEGAADPELGHEQCGLSLGDAVSGLPNDHSTTTERYARDSIAAAVDRDRYRVRDVTVFGRKGQLDQAHRGGSAGGVHLPGEHRQAARVDPTRVKSIERTRGWAAPI